MHSPHSGTASYSAGPPQASRQRRTPTTTDTFDILYPAFSRSSLPPPQSLYPPGTSGSPIMSPKINVGMGSGGYFAPYDPELGHGRPSTTSTRLVRRLMGRRGKWVGAAAVAGAVLFYVSSWRTGDGPGALREEPFWQDMESYHPSPESFESPVDLSNLEYVVDRYGDHFYASFPNITHIPTFDPDISLLPSPEELFPEVDLETFLRPPKIRQFPPSQIREIVSPPPAEVGRNLPTQEFPEDAFVLSWTGPEDWDRARKQGKGVQHVPNTTEEEEWTITRKARGEAVRRGFAHAWQAYKDLAWGHDEVRPITKAPSDPFNNWGASIVDTLDTLLLLDFNDEYNLCRAHVNQLKFEWHNGRDWAHGYILPPPAGSDEVSAEEELSIGRDPNVGLGIFETAIRYLGGLLGAYDLSGDDLMLERALDLAHIIKRAYNTQSGLPAGRIDPGVDHIIHLGTISLAEIGTMTLELFRLGQITGDRQWHDLAQRTIDYLDTRVIPRSVQTPLIPLWFQPDAKLGTNMTGTFGWGGLADSYYEYLIKAYRLLGGEHSPQAEQYKRIYTESVDKSKRILFWDVDIVPGRDLLAIGKWDTGRPAPEVEHLTCFAGAMLGLGATLLDRPDDMEDAQSFTETCYWLSAATPSGLQPESVEFYDDHNADLAFDNISIATGKAYHPHASKLNLEQEIEEGRVQVDGNGVHHWTIDWTEVETAHPERPEHRGPEKYYQKLSGVPAGTRTANGRGINRPETIESIFYMYRLTGDRKWQNRGWKMFVSWMQAAKVEGGISSIQDVTSEKIIYSDNMESFMFAETFKYHYLLHADTDLMSLDDYVLNTEAHPLISNPSHLPGHSQLWTPPASTSPHHHLGKRAEGTPAQKWARYEVLEPRKASLRDAAAGGTGIAKDGGGHHKAAGGKGMGGGGGRPGVLPDLPKEFFLRPGVITAR